MPETESPEAAEDATDETSEPVLPPDAVVFTLDGREIVARKGELVIAAAERHGTYIPRFCYHPRMSSVGMCRMCIVEIDTGRGATLQPACMIPVADGMTVATESDRTVKAQDGVLEFLLINHPLDCPVCDKGGECPLQDQTLAFGPGETRFIEEKRHFEKPIPLSDLVFMDRERCILCDRCTRFSREVADDPLISFIGRGDRTEVNTFPDHPFASYFSGNTVQICPVGALTAKPYRFKARPWDLDQVESTCTSCAVGCRVAVQSSSNRLVRYLGVDVDPVNWGWLCDKGRFDFEAVHRDERLGAPLVRATPDAPLEEANWSDALERVASSLDAARAVEGGVAVLGGARLTNEEAYAWSKLARTVLRTDSVDAQLGDGIDAEAVLGLPRATIDAACAADVCVLLGPDLKEELPVLFLRLRDAVVNRGLRVLELSTVATSMTPYAAASVRYHPGQATDLVRSLLAGEAGDGIDAAAELLGGAGSVVCVLGRQSVAESGRSFGSAAAALLEGKPGTTFLTALRRGNVIGALDMGLAPGVLPGRVALDEGREWFGEWGELPRERGLDATGILTAAAEGRLGALVLLGADPLGDFPDHDLARRALEAVPFTVAVDCFVTGSSAAADVVLPAAAYGEKRGTTTNVEGRVSRINQKVTAPGTARTDWVLAVDLAYRLGADLGFETLEETWDEIERLAPSHQGVTRSRLASAEALDGIVAGEAADAAGGDVPPSMSQADEPGVAAADSHMGPGSVNVSSMESPSEQPDPSQGSGPAGAPEALAESFGATSGSEHGDDAAEAEAVDRSVEAAHGDAGDGDAGNEDGGGDGEGGEEEVAAPRRPALLRYAADPGAVTPASDTYSLRLVATRKLYDDGVFVQQSPSLAPLATGNVPLRVHPGELERLGLTSGAQVRVTSSRTTLVLVAVADEDVPRGVAAMTFNQAGPGPGNLIDATAPVTDLRVETL